MPLNKQWLYQHVDKAHLALGRFGLLAVHERGDGQTELPLLVTLLPKFLHDTLSPAHQEVAWLGWVRDIRSVQSLAEKKEHILPLYGRVRVGRNARLEPAKVLKVSLQVCCQDHGNQCLTELAELFASHALRDITPGCGKHDAERPCDVEHFQHALVVILDSLVVARRDKERVAQPRVRIVVYSCCQHSSKLVQRPGHIAQEGCLHEVVCGEHHICCVRGIVERIRSHIAFLDLLQVCGELILRDRDAIEYAHFLHQMHATDSQRIAVRRLVKCEDVEVPLLQLVEDGTDVGLRYGLSDPSRHDRIRHPRRAAPCLVSSGCALRSCQPLLRAVHVITATRCLRLRN
mmetsp:Transcript_39783/g.105106  ORF Transcript_39783/g.105106 Transcript_39783/m.105106 type:complete len:346 (-) Transcript_39783:813-1850(-)